MLPLIRIVLDSELSSEFFLETEDITTTSVAVDPNEREWQQYFSERRSLPNSTDLSAIWEPISEKESTYALHFLSRIAIKEHATDILLSRFKHHESVLIYKRGEAIPRITSGPLPQFQPEGPPDDAWTVSAWVLSGTTAFDRLSSYFELEEFEKDMRDILNQFNQGGPLPRPNSIVQIAEEIAGNLAEPEQEAADTWADRLAEDLSKIID
jgi:hypothetical protein